MYLGKIGLVEINPLLIVLNGIEIVERAYVYRLYELLIVLNGIEICYTWLESG